MVTMGRELRSLAAVLAIVALVAMLPAPCPCPEESTAPPRGHECCAPPAGLSASEHGCCVEHEGAEADLLTPGPVAMPLLGEVAVVRTEPVARLEGTPRGSALPWPSPPPPVLRI
jgi:hypothetical protein